MISNITSRSKLITLKSKKCFKCKVFLNTFLTIIGTWMRSRCLLVVLYVINFILIICGIGCFCNTKCSCAFPVRNVLKSLIGSKKPCITICRSLGQCIFSSCLFVGYNSPLVDANWARNNMQVFQHAKPLTQVPLVGPLLTPPVNVTAVARVSVRAATDPVFPPGVVDVYGILRYSQQKSV